MTYINREYGLPHWMVWLANCYDWLADVLVWAWDCVADGLACVARRVLVALLVSAAVPCGVLIGLRVMRVSFRWWEARNDRH